jgi:hypothetical protein
MPRHIVIAHTSDSFEYDYCYNVTVCVNIIGNVST